MKKLLSALILTIGIVLLTGCGDGGSSSSANSSTTGNTQFYVSNNDKVDYARVDIEDNSGNIQSSTPISCSAQSSCNFKANMPLAGSLLFYDANNTMVNAYILVDPPSDMAFVTTSKDMLGIYLLSAYNNSTPDIDILVDGSRLLNFFQNYSKTGFNSDIPNDLGFYYQSQVIGTGLSYKDFISKLNTQLQNGVVLAPNLFVKNNLSLFDQFLTFFKKTHFIQSAYAGDNLLDNTICSSSLQTYGKFAGSLPNSFRDDRLKDTVWSSVGALVPPPYGGIISIALPLIADNCKKSDGTAAALQKISAQLKAVQATVDQNSGQLSSLLSLTGNQGASTILQKMKANTEVLEAFQARYQTILIGNGNLSNQQYTNLSDFVAKNGGSIQSAFQNNEKFQYILNNLNNIYWITYKDLVQQDKSLFSQSLAAICNGPSTDDLVKSRVNCNVGIGLYKAYILTASPLASALITDIFQMVDNNPNDASFISSKTLLTQIGALSNSWMANYSSSVAPIITMANDSIISGFAIYQNPPNDFLHGDTGGGYYVLADGLPTDLINNLTTLGCVNSDDKQVSLLSNFQPGSNTSITASIVVTCPGGDGNRYNSKYHYASDGNKIRLVMGVVAPVPPAPGMTTNGGGRNIPSYYNSKGIAISADQRVNASDGLSFSGIFPPASVPPLSLTYDINKVSITGTRYDPLQNQYFSFTDNGTFRLSWAWDVQQYIRTSNTEYVINCISSTCGLGSADNAIGFRKGGGPDPVIMQGKKRPYFNINGVDASVTAALEVYGN